MSLGSNFNVAALVGIVPGSQAPVIQVMLDGQFYDQGSLPDSGDSRIFYLLNGTGTPQGSHVLEVEVIDSDDIYPFWFDHILYQVPSGTAPTGAQSVVEQDGSIPTGAATTLPSASPVAQSSGASLVGPIVGGVVGGLALIVGALVALYFIKVKHGKKGKPYFYASDHGGDIFGAGALLDELPRSSYEC